MIFLLMFLQMLSAAPTNPAQRKKHAPPPPLPKYVLPPQHDPILVKLSDDELKELGPNFTPNPQTWALIHKHFPANEPKASMKPCTVGYFGRLYRPDKIVYVWESPCQGK